MKRVLKYFRLLAIDVHVYSMRIPVEVAFPEMKYVLKTENLNNGTTRYFMNDQGEFVHQSFLYPKLHLLKLLGKTGPAIGNCATNENYRGHSIYPFVINHIATGLLSENKAKEVFIIVNSNNIASIKGIEKAGFSFHSKVKAKRFLLFYFDKEITKA